MRTVTRGAVASLYRSSRRRGSLMARKQYFVSPDGHMWKLTHPGATLSRHHTKAVAIQSGRTAANANQPSQLIVQKADGTLETEWTYGDDPCPPPG